MNQDIEGSNPSIHPIYIFIKRGIAMKLIETEKGNFLITKIAEETDIYISANVEDVFYIHLTTNGNERNIGLVPLASENNIFGIKKSYYPKSRVILHDLDEEKSILVKEAKKLLNKIIIVSAPATGSKLLDKKILTGGIK